MSDNPFLHHRTWWAVTSQKDRRGKTLLFSAMKHVQAVSSLEDTQDCSNTAGGVQLHPCFTAKKRRLSRSEQRKQNCLGSGRQASQHFPMFAGIFWDSLTLSASPSVSLLQGLSWPATEGCAHMCFEETPRIGCHCACIYACMCMSGRNE